MVLVPAVVSGGHLSALLAAPAFAGNLDPISALITDAICNDTPYQWNFVDIRAAIAPSIGSSDC
jgi:hypothetical protein